PVSGGFIRGDLAFTPVRGGSMPVRGRSGAVFSSAIVSFEPSRAALLNPHDAHLRGGAGVHHRAPARRREGAIGGNRVDPEAAVAGAGDEEQVVRNVRGHAEGAALAGGDGRRRV